MKPITKKKDEWRRWVEWIVTTKNNQSKDVSEIDSWKKEMSKKEKSQEKSNGVRKIS